MGAEVGEEVEAGVGVGSNVGVGVTDGDGVGVAADVGVGVAVVFAAGVTHQIHFYAFCFHFPDFFPLPFPSAWGKIIKISCYLTYKLSIILSL